MPESFEEQLATVEMIADGSICNLGSSDFLAVKAVLKALKQSNAMCKDLAEQLKAVVK